MYGYYVIEGKAAGYNAYDVIVMSLKEKWLDIIIHMMSLSGSGCLACPRVGGEGEGRGDGGGQLCQGLGRIHGNGC